MHYMRQGQDSFILDCVDRGVANSNTTGHTRPSIMNTKPYHVHIKQDLSTVHTVPRITRTVYLQFRIYCNVFAILVPYDMFMYTV